MSAENAAAQASESPPAGDGLLIPKSRLDEVLAENRRLREEQSIKDNLYLQERQRALAPQPQTPQLPSAEELGLDPATHKAVTTLIAKTAGALVAQERQAFEGQLGMLSARTEKAELLAAHGADKAKYLPEIQRRQQEHYRNTGGFMPADIVLKLIEADEKDARIKSLEARLSGTAPTQSAPTAAPAAGVQAPARGVPTGAGGQLPGVGGAGGSGGAKSFAEKTIAEMEAELDAHMSSTGAAL